MTTKFPVMLASPNKMISRINFPCIAQTKMDGMRAMIIVKDNETIVYSRNGKVMKGLGKHFEPMVNHNNMVYDGELTVTIESGFGLLDRKAGNGILHKAVVGTISPEEIERVRITLWDIIGTHDWEDGYCATPYHARLAELKSLPKSGLFSIVETFDVNNMDEAQEIFQKMLAKGEEGIILKNNDHPWENKRSTQIVKMKEVIETDLKITGFAEGTGKASKMLGALQCSNKDGSIKVDVGTGFTDDQRVNIWGRQDELLNTVVTVKNNGVITRKDKDVKSLFLPVFIELRPDKEESD